MAKSNPQDESQHQDTLGDTVEHQPREFSSPGVQLPTTSQFDEKLPDQGDLRQNEEYRKLVQHRIQIVAIVTAFVFTLVFTGVLLDSNPFFRASQLGAIGSCLFGSSILLPILCLFQIRLSSHTPLKILRRWEIAVLFSVGLTMCFFEWRLFSATDVANFEGPKHVESYLAMINFARCLEWFILIVAYGLTVPNVWYRTAMISACLAVFALLVIPLAAMESPLVRENGAYLLTWTVVTLLIASLIASFGAFNISSLQQEVFVARKLGPYQLKKRIGGGGMGEVYLAEHSLLKRPCAVKVIRPERARERQLISRFEREVRVTSQLTHPCTIKIFDYGHTEDGTFYYVMEFLEGQNLDDLVREHGPQPPGRVAHFIRQLCGALREAHSQGLVHRDIKPGNVIVCKQGGMNDVVKLLDFGLVATLQEDNEGTRLTEEGITLGTPQFMAPEQVRGADSVGPRSDLYSLGGMMFFLLSGKLPFEAKSQMGMLLAHLEQPVPSIREHCPEIPDDLEAIVVQCLAKKPDERFTDASSLADAVENCRCWQEWDNRAISSLH